MKKPLKIWLVKREVLATSIQQAIRGGGTVYEVTEAAKEYQPEEKPKLGFKPRKTKTK